MAFFLGTINVIDGRPLTLTLPSVLPLRSTCKAIEGAHPPGAAEAANFLVVFPESRMRVRSRCAGEFGRGSVTQDSLYAKFPNQLVGEGRAEGEKAPERNRKRARERLQIVSDSSPSLSLPELSKIATNCERKERRVVSLLSLHQNA